MNPTEATAQPTQVSTQVLSRKSGLSTELMTINMGPSHPGTHGVLRVVLDLDGEVIVRAQPVLGYLHSGKEKIAESLTYHQFIPYTDRLDYLAPLSSNVGYVLTVEKLLDVEAPLRAQFIRVLCCELARISAHLLWLATMALDLGAATVFFYAFREREKLYRLFEDLCGVRMNTAYTRVGGLAWDMPQGFPQRVWAFLEQLPSTLDECEYLLTRNRIWLGRTEGVGVISKEDAIAQGFTGPNLRACGVDYDLRKVRPYSSYDQFEFDVPLEEAGDAYARYLVRMEEMRQARRIALQALTRMPGGPVCVQDTKVSLPPKRSILTNMEELIHDFEIIVFGHRAPKGEVYHSIEAPKGELGFYIISEGGGKPYRLKIRAPSFCNVSALPQMVEGRLLSDMVTVISSLDPVMGEMDR